MFSKPAVKSGYSANAKLVLILMSFAMQTEFLQHLQVWFDISGSPWTTTTFQSWSCTCLRNFDFVPCVFSNKTSQIASVFSFPKTSSTYLSKTSRLIFLFKVAVGKIWCGKDGQDESFQWVLTVCNSWYFGSDKTLVRVDNFVYSHSIFSISTDLISSWRAERKVFCVSKSFLDTKLFLSLFRRNQTRIWTRWPSLFLEYGQPVKVFHPLFSISSNQVIVFQSCDWLYKFQKCQKMLLGSSSIYVEILFCENLQAGFLLLRFPCNVFQF